MGYALKSVNSIESMLREHFTDGTEAKGNYRPSGI